MGMSKYISHLDLLRCFTRAIMRSGLPIEYSQGFNPHQKMTFALPLPVGVTSECEYVDISFEDGKVEDDEIRKKLDINFPPDINVISVGDLFFKACDIVCAEYIVRFHCGDTIEKSWVRDFFARDEIVVMKKTKKKVDKPINLLEYVRAWEATEANEGSMELRLVLDAGGERNIKPDMIVKAFCEKYPMLCADEAEIHRKEIFCKTNSDNVLEIFR